MKKIFKSILALTMCVAMFAGCKQKADELPAYENYNNAKTTLDADDYSKFMADETVYIMLSANDVKVKSSAITEAVSLVTDSEDGDKTVFTDDDGNKCKVSLVEESAVAGKEKASGIEIDNNKTSKKVKYIISGEYTGTIQIKNKSSDCAIVLDGVTLKSEKGPVFHITTDKTRTFIVSESGKTNTLTDGRVSGGTILNDNKGTIYANGAVIFDGGGTLNVVNKGYKHAIYSGDYIRMANGTLNVTVGKDTKKGRDCIRALNAFIMDNGKVSLEGYGEVSEDESVGIKVEGEDVSKKHKVTYTPGAGFIIINGGELSVNTYAKGITAHRKDNDSCIDKIGTEDYTDSGLKSLLAGTNLIAKNAEKPNPYVEINGGKIDITTFGTKTENCNPKGIEAKAGLTINDGCVITIKSTGNPLPGEDKLKINGGYVKANDEVITK